MACVMNRTLEDPRARFPVSMSRENARGGRVRSPTLNLANDDADRGAPEVEAAQIEPE